MITVHTHPRQTDVHRSNSMTIRSMNTSRLAEKKRRTTRCSLWDAFNGNFGVLPYLVFTTDVTDVN